MGQQVPTLDGVPLILIQTIKIMGMVLSMEAQITKMAKMVFHYQLQVRQLALDLSQSDLPKVIHATFTSRLDYCN